MSDKTHIEWTDATYNPITGCSVVSPGCTNCYAMKLAGGRLRNHPSRAGLTNPSKAGPVWNGEVRFNEEWLGQPLRWRRPRRIFVCAHGDLFHEDVPDDWIDRVFAVMALAPQHQFQVLTKRAERMRAYLANGSNYEVRCNAIGRWVLELDDDHVLLRHALPLPNVWLGVSVEDRARLDRIDSLRQTPAAIRFLSLEPLLEDLGEIDLTGIGWVIVGGESGGGARPMHPDWPRVIQHQCQDAGVSFFFKQWGEWLPWRIGQCAEYPVKMPAPGSDGVYIFEDKMQMLKVGKKAAGRQLDWRTWDEMPA